MPWPVYEFTAPLLLYALPSMKIVQPDNPASPESCPPLPLPSPCRQAALSYDGRLILIADPEVGLQLVGGDQKVHGNFTLPAHKAG